MKCMVDAEWNELHRIKREHDELIAQLARADFSGSLVGRAEALVCVAKLMGYVLTIEQVSRPPPAMSRYDTVVSTQPVYVRAPS